MKHIKIYENKKSKFKIGDFVVAYKFETHEDELSIFFKKHTGLVTNINKDYSVDVEYINIPSNIENKFYDLTNNNICFRTCELRLATSEEIKQYKLQKDINKYNL